MHLPKSLTLFETVNRLLFPCSLFWNCGGIMAGTCFYLMNLNGMVAHYFLTFTFSPSLFLFAPSFSFS